MKINKIHFSSLLFCIFLLIEACAEPPRDIENYGNIGSTPGGAKLETPSEHKPGWGRRECFLCHNASAIHRTSASLLDADAILERVVQESVSYCLTCHGPNGISN